MKSRPDVLLIDNYDSFTYNLFQAIEWLGYRTRVVRNDRIRVSEIAGLRPRCLVISPGPGTPDDSGVTLAAIAAYSGKFPLLGVCLGHQALGQAMGGRVIRAPRPIHGKSCAIEHDRRDLFRGLDSPAEVMRYHSLVLEARSLPRTLKVTSRTSDGLIMSVRHKRHPSWGVQFHPESIGTPLGIEMLRNFFQLSGLGPR